MTETLFHAFREQMGGQPRHSSLSPDGGAGPTDAVRLHRNCVSVVERLNWMDVSLATLAR